MRHTWIDGADYVECDECGHPVEEHTTAACLTSLDEPCACPARFTMADKRDLRADAGLPRRSVTYGVR